MRLFEVDFKRLALLLMPTMLRRLTLFALVRCCVLGVESVYNLFTTNRNSNLRKLQVNGQVCYLRGYLNDLFDDELRRIEIVDGVYADDWVFVYDESEANQLFVDYDLIIFDESAVGGEDMSFVVKAYGVPMVNDNRMRSVINEFKLAGKTYFIKYYE